MPGTESSMPACLLPEWEAPPVVRAFVTLRTGGCSRGVHGVRGGGAGGWNLATHCGDDPAHVAANRARLRALLPGEPIWLDQVHGCDVHDADAAVGDDEQPAPVADAAFTTRRGRVLAVMTADCLPVLLAARDASVVGVAHAGWRGLAAGVVERTVERMMRAGSGGPVVAWLGPAIGPQRFEVGGEVREAFVDADPAAAAAFVPGACPGKWFADLYALARLRLAACGVREVSGGDLCTVADEERFYSYRRDRQTGRMASVIWIA